MEGAHAASARRGGSSYGSGPRRGADPEGGERSAWKGLTGPSGLNLDHSRIPQVQSTVFDVLTPLVVAVEDPIPLSQFTQKCCDLLLPVLERQRELGPHEFKSQWGRLNEFVCPELARRAGVGDSGYSREHKTVRIDLKAGVSTQAAARRGAAPAAASEPAVPPGFPARAPPSGSAPTAAAASAPLAAAAEMRAPQGGAAPHLQAHGPRGLPLPVLLPAHAHASGARLAALPAGAVTGLAVLPPAPCSYCQGPHSMKNCRDFHTMLQTIYQAGYQQGMAAAQQAHGQLAPAAQPPSAAL